MSLELPEFFPTAGLPEADDLVVSTGGYKLRIRRECPRPNLADVPLEPPQFAARSNIPKPCRAVGAGRDQGGAVSGKSDRVDDVCVALELADFLAGRLVPQANHLVTGSGQDLAVRGESDAARPTVRCLEAPEFLACL